MYKSCEVYRCFYNKDGCCLYDESPLQPPSSKACYDYDEEYNNRYNRYNNKKDEDDD